MVDLAEIQGIVASGYGSLPYAHFFFVRINDRQRARQWLADILPLVTTATSNPKANFAINIGFTYIGLERMDLGMTAQAFPREFQEGMGNPDRMRQLGDTGESGQEHWHLGGNDQPEIHMLLMVYGETPAIFDEQRTEIRRSMDGIFSVVYEQASIPPRPDGAEAFGFRDGISQPAVEGINSRILPGQDVVRTGEFVMGYRDEYGFVPLSPGVPAAYDPGSILPDSPDAGVRDFGKNGTYLVFRKLKQDPAAFNDYVERTSQDLRQKFNDQSMTPEWVGAKLMGRWKSGAPLVLAPEKDDSSLGKNLFLNNAFDYGKSDPFGEKCPIASHIRRSNPRGDIGSKRSHPHLFANRHRLLRRGRPYSERNNGENECGLLFMAVNADIARQFEFVQQTWLNNSQFEGLYDDKDPVVSNNDGDREGVTIPYKPVRIRIEGLQRFVTVKGGGYFFLPSRAALKFMASDFPRIVDKSKSDTKEMSNSPILHFVWELGYPLRLLKKKALRLYPRLKLRVVKRIEGGLVRPLWRKLLFDLLFGFLRRHCPVYVAHPANLAIVTSYDDVREVMRNDAVFTTVYMREIKATTGPFTVGMPVDSARYKAQMALMRNAAAGSNLKRIYRSAAKRAKQLIAQAAVKGRIDAVGGLAHPVAADFVDDYLGVPGPDETTLIRWIEDIFREIFMNLGQFKSVEKIARTSACELEEYLTRLVADRRIEIAADKADDNFLNRMLQIADNTVSDDEIVRIIGGTVVGTAGLSKAFAQALDQLLDRPDELQRAQDAARNKDFDLVSAYMFEALRFNPQNPILFRRASHGMRVAASGHPKFIHPGTKVVVGIVSAMFDEKKMQDPKKFLISRPPQDYLHFGFGPHACFARTQAQIVIPEIAMALLQLPNLRRVPGRQGKLAYDGAFPARLMLEFG